MQNENEEVDSYDELSFGDLKEEVDARKLDRKGLKSKEDLVKLLDKDDEDGEEGEEKKDEKEDENAERLQPEDKEEETVAPKVDEDPDYLKKFQYKKVNGNPKVGGEHTDPDEGSKAETMKKFLLGQDKVSIMIPMDGNSDTDFSVCLNGYRLDLPRNTYIEVPEQVANVVMDSQHQQVEALKYKKIDPKKVDPALQ